MKILVIIGHPAHVHNFKNMIWNLEKDGNDVKIVANDKEMTLNLLDAYGFDYEKFGKSYQNLTRKMYGLVVKDLSLLKIAKKYKPDMFISRGSPYGAHVSRLLHKPHIAFNDTEIAKLSDMLSVPFLDAVCTPSCYKRNLGKKQIKYNGYKELAYLHPDYFKPDSSVLDDLGLNKGDKFIVLRFVSWNASHDISDKGFEDLKKAVEYLEQFGRVFITSETDIGKEFEKYRITIPADKIHHLLYFANLYIGESATMASESAILGTPAIFISTSRRGYTDELEKIYGLVYNFSDVKMRQKFALDKAFELLEDRDLKKKWEYKRRKMLSEKIDVTKFMTEFVENFPESFYKYMQSKVK